MKVLLFGSKGYIGSEFVNQLNKIGEVILVTEPSRKPNGIHYSFFELLSIVMKHLPDAIINCAAYIGKTSVVECEKNKDQTILSNFTFPKMLGEICQDNGIILGHMSSGCLFNGYTTEGFREDDNIHLSFNKQCSFYTGTKVMAEESLINVKKKYIWRIRLPFDNQNNPRNYLSKVMKFDKLLAAENSLSHRKESVAACVKCLIDAVPFGTYHVANPGGIRPDEIVYLLRKILKNNKNFQYFESTDVLDKLTNIPRSNTVLNVDKLKSVGIEMTNVHDSIESCLSNWIE